MNTQKCVKKKSVKIKKRVEMLGSIYFTATNERYNTISTVSTVAF